MVYLGQTMSQEHHGKILNVFLSGIVQMTLDFFDYSQYQEERGSSLTEYFGGSVIIIASVHNFLSVMGQQSSDDETKSRVTIQASLKSLEEMSIK